MEEHILSDTPGFKVYKEQSIYIGTFLGGPLIAGYLAAENFKRFGQFDKAKISWVIGILSTIIIFGGIAVIPNADKVPRYLIPIGYTLITQFLIKKYQSASIKLHIDAGGQTFTTWRDVWISLVGLAFLLIVMFAILLLTNPDILEQ